MHRGWQIYALNNADENSLITVNGYTINSPLSIKDRIKQKRLPERRSRFLYAL